MRRAGKHGMAAIVAACFAIPATAPQALAQAGCDMGRPAVAHHSGGEALPAPPEKPPVPCMTVTGDAIEAATVGVTKSGVVFFGSIEQNPDGVRTIVDPSVVARSTDQGRSWENVVPGDTPVSPHGSLSPWLRVDPATSRVWYATPTAPCGATVSWSDDDGKTWATTPNIGCPAQGGVALMEGPAPADTEKPAGYPHVVYYCANAQDGENSVLVCHRSLDGGRNWQSTGGSPDPVPAEDGCAPGTLRTTRAGDVGPDGVLYFPTFSCDDRVLGIAVSRDQGRTWTRRKVLDAEIQDIYPPALAIDARGTLYIAWKGAGGLPYLTASNDRGEHWSKPAMIAAPGVNAMRRLGIVARGPGHILVSYLASTDGGDSYDAYMTESRNAAAAEPTFWSAPVNDPSKSVLNRGAAETYAERIQLLRGHISDDGTPWAGFHCFDTQLCPGRRLGLAAQLRWPAAGPGDSPRTSRIALRVRYRGRSCSRRRSMHIRVTGPDAPAVRRIAVRHRGQLVARGKRSARIRLSTLRRSGDYVVTATFRDGHTRAFRNHLTLCGHRR